MGDILTGQSRRTFSASGGALPRWGTKQVSLNYKTVPPYENRGGALFKRGKLCYYPTPLPHHSLKEAQSCFLKDEGMRNKGIRLRKAKEPRTISHAS